MQQQTRKGKLTTTTVTLPPQMIIALDAEAERSGDYGRSAVIRRAVRQFLDTQKKKGAASNV